MGSLLVCPECAHEWAVESAEDEVATDSPVEVRDSAGNVLQDGDTVTITKDLKVKGSTSTLKKGTKIKSIRLPEAADGHDVECRLDIGTIMLKSEFLKKA